MHVFTSTEAGSRHASGRNLIVALAISATAIAIMLLSMFQSNFAMLMTVRQHVSPAGDLAWGEEAPPSRVFMSASACRVYAAWTLRNPTKASTDLLVQCAADNRAGLEIVQTALVRHYYATGVQKEAAALLQNAPSLERSLRFQARDALTAGDAETARELSDIQYNSGIWPSSLLLVHAEALTALGDFSAAEEAYRRSLQRNAFDPDDIQTSRSATLYSFGRMLESRGRWTDATLVFHELVANSPENANGWLRLAIVELARKNNPAAKDAIQRSLVLLDRDWSRMYAGRIELANGNLSEAIELWWRAYLLEHNQRFLHEFATVKDSRMVGEEIATIGIRLGVTSSDLITVAEELRRERLTESADAVEKAVTGHFD